MPQSRFSPSPPNTKIRRERQTHCYGSANRSPPWAKKKLIAVTIDHGLRPEGAREAAAVKRLARRLGVAHRILRWRGTKPKTGLQEAARSVRYRLLGQAAAKAGCAHILTAHTLDDQAETVLFRLARGSGLVGLAGMTHVSPLPMGADRIAFLPRPLVRHPKAP